MMWQKSHWKCGPGAVPKTPKRLHSIHPVAYCGTLTAFAYHIYALLTPKNCGKRSAADYPSLPIAEKPRESPDLRTWLGSAVTQAVDSNGTSGSLPQNLVRKRLDTRFWPDLKAKSRFSGKFDDVAMCRQSSLYHDCRPHVRRSGVTNDEFHGMCIRHSSLVIRHSHKSPGGD